MSRNRKDNKAPDINGNWVKTENVKIWKATAKQVLEIEKKKESEHQYKYVQVGTMPKTFKRVLVKR